MLQLINVMDTMEPRWTRKQWTILLMQVTIGNPTLGLSNLTESMEINGISTHNSDREIAGYYFSEETLLEEDNNG